MIRAFCAGVKVKKKKNIKKPCMYIYIYTHIYECVFVCDACIYKKKRAFFFFTRIAQVRDEKAERVFRVHSWNSKVKVLKK